MFVMSLRHEGGETRVIYIGGILFPKRKLTLSRELDKL